MCCEEIVGGGGVLKILLFVLINCEMKHKSLFRLYLLDNNLLFD